MGFAEIECLGAAVPLDALPRDGLLVTTRAAPYKPGRVGPVARYIVVRIGVGLAAKLKLLGQTSAARLLFGNGDDAGKIALTVDQAGRFAAKRRKDGSWTITINAASAEGLFSTDFPAFCVIEPEVIALAGKAPFVKFEASAAMMAVD